MGMDNKQGHQRVIQWTMACIILHNLLSNFRDDRSWLQEPVEREVAEEADAEARNQNNNIEREGNIEAKRPRL